MINNAAYMFKHRFETLVHKGYEDGFYMCEFLKLQIDKLNNLLDMTEKFRIGENDCIDLTNVIDEDEDARDAEWDDPEDEE